MTWQPILDGELGELGDQAIFQIASELTSRAITPREGPALAVWWAYAADRLPNVEACYDDAASALLQLIELDQASIALHGGLAGAAWSLAHISNGGADEALDALDQRFAAIVSTIDDTELVSGLAGIAVYLLERPDSAIARDTLKLIVERIDVLATVDGDGTAWRGRRHPYDCGVAHGIPGVIAVLGRIAALPEASPRADAVCVAATTWIRAQRLEPNPLARFPTGVDRGRPIGRPPNAWCYGDPGLVAAMWSSAVRTKTPVTEWHELAVEAAARSAADSRVEVAGLCHGAIGLAHLFNRCYQASGDLRLRDAARRWFANGLEMRRTGEGIAGFVAPALRNDEISWVGSTSFLEGVTGIGLALLAALGDEEPGWDRLLACDIPPMDQAAGGSDSV